MSGYARNASVGILLNIIEPESKKLFRDLEKLNKKYTNKKFGVTFNQTCLNEKLLPNYIYTYISFVSDLFNFALT